MEVECSVLVPSQYAVSNREVASRDAANSEMPFCGSQLYSIWRKTKIVFIPTNWWSECAGCVPEWMSVHDPGTRLHPAVPVPQQSSQIPILPARHPDLPGKRSSSSKRRISCASWRSVFCLRTRVVRIAAASPIHNSNCDSATSRSNKRACPLASVPNRTFSPARAGTFPRPRDALAVFPGTNLRKETRICVSFRGNSWSLRCGLATDSTGTAR